MNGLVASPIHVPQAVLDDLQRRLRATRWPDELDDARGVWGPRLGWIQQVCRTWADAYDWRSTEARLAAYPQYETVIDGQRIHFLWIRSAASRRVPLLMTHGWPGSIVEFLDVIDPLVAPERFGVPDAVGFDLVLPSLPGYGFSGPTVASGWDMTRVAQTWRRLMQVLGYGRYAAQGGDWGSMVSTRLALLAPDEMLGLHLNMALAPRRPGAISDTEQTDLDDVVRFVKTGSAYQVIQGRSPQTLAYGLNDSPAGLAAWILDKFQRWSDNDGDVEQAIPLNRLLDNLTVYWITSTINSSTRLYAEAQRAGDFGAATGRVSVPTGIAIYPKEMFRYPRSWLDQAFNVVHYRRMPRGGHFAAMEEPDLFVADVREFFGDLLAASPERLD
ncbi:MAG TPA: epoxide hydrolase [Ottowia sp.]|uniref:epoxide hydrolase family protein n=1 Tax=Ottowia sp. TaxID=1898956 RepID=UPI002CAF0D40|nr:epoxide hydrolase [Ottowia sp.]HMN21713.1 epoxide hydrolase [Ottowia sp.]